MYVCMWRLEIVDTYVCGSGGDLENLLRTICGAAAIVSSGG